MSENANRAGEKRVYKQKLSKRAQKTPLVFIFRAKLNFFSASHSRVRMVESHVTFHIHSMHGIETFDTLFPSLLCTLDTGHVLIVRNSI